MARKYKYLFTVHEEWSEEPEVPPSFSGPARQEEAERVYEAAMRRKMFLDYLGNFEGLGNARSSNRRVSKWMMGSGRQSAESSEPYFPRDSSELREAATAWDLADLVYSLVSDYPFLDPESPGVGEMDTGTATATAVDVLQKSGATVYGTPSYSRYQASSAFPGFPFRLMSDASYVSPSPRQGSVSVPDYDPEWGTPTVSVRVPGWRSYSPESEGSTFVAFRGSQVGIGNVGRGSFPSAGVKFGGSGISCWYFMSPASDGYLSGTAGLLRSVSFPVHTAAAEATIASSSAYMSYGCSSPANASGGFRTFWTVPDEPEQFPSYDMDSVARIVPACPYSSGNAFEENGYLPSQADYAGTELEEPLKTYVPPGVFPALDGMPSERGEGMGMYPPRNGWPFSGPDADTPGNPAVYVPHGQSRTFVSKVMYSALLRECRKALDRLRYTVIPVDAVLADFSFSASSEESLSCSTVVRSYERSYRYEDSDDPSAEVEEEEHWKVTKSVDADLGYSSSCMGSAVFDVCQSFGSDDRYAVGIRSSSGAHSWAYLLSSNVEEADDVSSAGPSFRCPSQRVVPLVTGRMGLYAVGSLCPSWGGIVVSSDGNFMYSYSGSSRKTVSYQSGGGTLETVSESDVKGCGTCVVDASWESSVEFSRIVPVLSSASYWSSSTESEVTSGTGELSAGDEVFSVSVKTESTGNNYEKRDGKKVPSDPSDEYVRRVYAGNVLPADSSSSGGNLEDAVSKYLIHPKMLPFVRSAELYAVVSCGTDGGRCSDLRHWGRRNNRSGGDHGSDGDWSSGETTAVETYRKRIVRVGTLDRSSGRFSGKLDLCELFGNFADQGSSGCPYRRPGSPLVTGAYRNRGKKGETRTYSYVSRDGEETVSDVSSYDYSEVHAASHPTGRAAVVGMFMVVDWNFDRNYDPWDSDSDSDSDSE